MTIKVAVGSQKEQPQMSAKKDAPIVSSVKLKVRRALNGDIMVFETGFEDVHVFWTR